MSIKIDIKFNGILCDGIFFIFKGLHWKYSLAFRYACITALGMCYVDSFALLLWIRWKYFLFLSICISTWYAFPVVLQIGVNIFFIVAIYWLYMCIPLKVKNVVVMPNLGLLCTYIELRGFLEYYICIYFTISFRGKMTCLLI